jgi:hypothetical protein
VTRARRLVFAAALAALAGLGVAVAYLQEVFVAAPFWDDQGYMMLSVRHLLDGHPLYDDIRVFYGPFYYLVTWVLHGPLGLPLTHDGVRMIGLVLRETTAALAAWAVFRITGVVVVGVVTFLTLGATAFTIMPEAGHPQELVVLLVAAMPAITRTDRPGRSAVGLGLLVAGLCMTKVNVGVFAGVAVWMALLSSTASSRTIAVIRIGSLVSCFLLPWAVLYGALTASWARLLASLVTAWIAAVATASFMRRREVLRPSHLVAFVLATGAGIVASTLFAIAGGSSLRALADSLVLGAQALTRYFVIPTPLFSWSAAVAAAGLLGAMLWAVAGASRSDGGGVTLHVAAAGKLAFGVVALLVTRRWGVTVLEGDRAVELAARQWLEGPAFRQLSLSTLTPFVWLVLLPGGEGRGRLPRVVLAWVAVLETLQVYPVPGSQLVCGTMPGLLCAFACLGDGCAWLGSLLPSALRRPIREATAFLVLALLALQTRSELAGWTKLHGALVPLGLPGAERTRVPREAAAELHALVAELQSRCTAFLVFPGVSSLYFWTGSQPPTLDLVPHQTRLLPDDRLAAMQSALQRSQSPCVVRCTGLAERVPDPRIEAWLEGRFRRGRSFSSCTVWEPAW